MTEKFILLDGNSLANRAFYAIPMLSNSQGFITNAIYGFCNMLNRILAEEKPEYIAVAFDKGRVVFRHKQYEQYKAQRKGTPDELRPQFPVLKKLLQAMNIACFELEGYEADDIIGTLVRWGEREKLENIIVTGDRDAFQLISTSTKVCLTRKGISEMEVYTEAVLKEKYDLLPWQMIELKGLMGDASDNIPGIPGVGEKTALKLLHSYGDIENTIRHKEDFKGKKLEQLLENYAEQARLSKNLATIDCSVPVEIAKEACRWREPNYEELKKMLEELEFKNILQVVSEKANTEQTAPVLEEDGKSSIDLQEIKEYLQGADKISLFLLQEKQKNQTNFIGCGILKKKGLPLYMGWENAEQRNQVIIALKSVLENKGVKKTIHDAKTAYVTLAEYGIKLAGVEYDTLLMSYLLNPSRPENDFAHITREHLGYDTNALTIPGKYFVWLRSLEALGKDLHEKLFEMEMWDLYNEIELPLYEVLAEMELEGVKLDKKELTLLGSELETKINLLTKEIYELAGEGFNINSPKQLGVILFEKLGLKRGKKTKTGYSTNAEVLETLAAEHEIVARILDYRQMVKLKTTYIDGLMAIMDSVTGKVHTTFNQAVTATGRLSSTEPNLQNIPIRMEEGRKIRKAFHPAAEDSVFLAADYSQIELRILAHLAEDEVLMEAFHKGQDIHARTASEVFGVPLETVNKDMRRAAKAVNFGIVYGISDYGLSQDLGISRGEAREYIDQYFARYRGVKQYIERTIAEAREKGYVTTIFKRRRYLPDILSRNFHLRSFAERMAMNTPIQGSAADIIKVAMLKMAKIIKEKELGAKILLQVHDELIFEVPMSEIEKTADAVYSGMSSVYSLLVPLELGLQSGPNWYDMRALLLKEEKNA